MRILLVEDDEADLHTIKEAVEDQFKGATLIVAASTREAQDQIRRLTWENAPLHVAILDINLPEKTGRSPRGDTYEFGLSGLIRERFEACLIIYLTAFETKKPVQEHIRSDMTHDRVIPKAADGDERLLETIRQYWQLQLLAWAKEILRPKSDVVVNMGRPCGPATGPGCSTIQVNTLLHEIACFRDNFTEEGKVEIEKYVRFVEENGVWRAEPMPLESGKGGATGGT